MNNLKLALEIVRTRKPGSPGFRQLIVLLWVAVGLFSLPGSAGETNGALTLEQVREIALRENPRVTAAELKALAARQTIIQSRSALLPALGANFVAVGTAEDETRLTAVGGLNNPIVFNRVAAGVSLSQLLTDFGRSANLLAGSKSRARAEEAGAALVRSQLLLAVSASFFSALQAESVVRVVDETLAARELVLEQVSALARQNLKSTLDVSFARVAVDEARLLQVRAKNDLASALTALGTLMGRREPPTNRLKEWDEPTPLPTDVGPLILDALRLRPELERFRAERDAAVQQARADRALHYPTLSAIGSAGLTPVGDDRLEENYAAAGFVMNLPLFNGGRDTARQRESAIKVKAAEAQLEDEENQIIRDVRLALLRAQHARERMTLTTSLADNARQSYELADSRYRAGTSSITELSQAQLNLTVAQIAQASARYEYLTLRVALEIQAGWLGTAGLANPQ